MNDDTIYDYLGREAEWVALCGFHHVVNGNERFTDNDAAGLIEFVWEFCEASCLEANATVPQKQEAVALLAAMISRWNDEQKSCDAGE